METEFRAAVSFNTSEANIYLNGNECKSIDMVLSAVAHETAHIVLNSSEDNIAHEKKWKELKKIITEKYYL